MRELNKTVSENITILRKKSGLTQAEFGAKLNYSDKSVSKWERGDSLPDLNALNSMAEAYNVPIEYFLADNKEPSLQKKDKLFFAANRIAVSLLCVCFIWLVAAVIYVYTSLYRDANIWTCFIWPIPISCLPLYFTSYKFFDHRADVYIGSVFIWTLLLSVYLQFIDYNVWIISFIGIPLQVAFILIEVIRRRQTKLKS